MADRLNDERTAFESWALSEGWTERNLRRDPTSGGYLDGGVAAIWLGWAARATHDSGVQEANRG